VISVAYYLNLFGAFAVNLTPFDSPVAAKVVTSAVLLAILAIGWTKGFSALERAEQISVSLKLAIIVGLLAGLAMFSAEVWSAQGPVISPTPLTGWPAVTLAFGLIVTVQGFETSRYLGQEYSAQTRIRSMRLAQVIATVIYLIYTVLLVYSMPPDPEALSETAIIDMMIVVAPILPPLLVAAALTAQFSAAVADTTGSGGLVAELTKGRVSPRGGYLLLVLAGLALTWTADVFQIIAYASRAFALYYGLQAAIAAMTAWSDRRQGNAIALFFTALALLGFVIVAFGRSVE
jgi:amino acid permease